jgi:hypothetical protein
LSYLKTLKTERKVWKLATHKYQLERRLQLKGRIKEIKEDHQCKAFRMREKLKKS